MCKFNLDYLHFHSINWCKLVDILVFTFGVRAFLSLLKAMETSDIYFRYSKSIKRGESHSPLDERKRVFSRLRWQTRFKWIFHGFSRHDPYPDYWYNTLIGFIEVCIFPILMGKQQYTYIGAWIGLKIVAQWDAWKLNRNAINRFVIATAIQLIFSYVCLANWPEFKK